MKFTRVKTRKLKKLADKAGFKPVVGAHKDGVKFKKEKKEKKPKARVKKKGRKRLRVANFIPHIIMAMRNSPDPYW